MIDIYVSLTNK